MYGLKITNGDIIKSRFPHSVIHIMKIEQCVRVFFDDLYYVDFPIGWWESLYNIDYIKEVIK